ncbi:MAG: ABC transporter ATP-binding protein [Actinomycetota bacterium]
MSDTVHAGSNAMGTTPPLLEVTGLRTSFDTPKGRVLAVDGVDLTLERGKTLGLVGESGSGKSVLSRSIMRLLPRTGVASEGSVKIEGEEITTKSPSELRAMWGPQLAMVFQDPMTSLNPVVKIGRQLTEHVRAHLGVDKAEAREMATAVLTEVGIPEPARRLQEYPHQLSGGMRQRVVIAIALACGPRLLFADEPTTALDVTVQAQILDLLQREQSDRDMGMILVTHDLGVVAGRADEIAVMYAGRIVERAPATALFNDMRMPYTEALFTSIPKLDYPSHTRLTAIGGRPPDLINPPKGCPFSPRCPYAKERCHDEAPPMREADEPGHTFACWYPVGSAEWHDARARRRREGTPVPVAVGEEPG